MSAAAPEMNVLPLYALVLTLEYAEEDADRIAQTVQSLAASQAGQKPGYSFAAYTERPGSERKLYVLAPLPSTPETEEGSALSNESPARETLETLMDGLKTSESLIVRYISELSNPLTGNQIGPAPYVRLISATIKPDVAEEHTKTAQAAARKIVAAHQRNTKGCHFVTYHSYRGSADVFHIAVPLASLDELDDRVDNFELVQEMYDADEAAGLLEAIDQVVAESVSRVIEYHPFVSAKV